MTTLTEIYGLLSWNFGKKLWNEWKKDSEQKMVFIKKYGYFILFQFNLFEHSLERKIMICFKLKISIHLCCYNFNNKKYLICQVFVVNWSNFGTKNCLNFSTHTATVKKLVRSVYLHLGYSFLLEYTEKVNLFTDVNNLVNFFYLSKKNMVFVYFSWFFTVFQQYLILQCEFWKINTICIWKISLDWFAVNLL